MFISRTLMVTLNQVYDNALNRISLPQMLNVYYLVRQITEEEYIELSGLLAQV